MGWGSCGVVVVGEAGMVEEWRWAEIVINVGIVANWREYWAQLGMILA